MSDAGADDLGVMQHSKHHQQDAFMKERYSTCNSENRAIIVRIYKQELLYINQFHLYSIGLISLNTTVFYGKTTKREGKMTQGVKVLTAKTDNISSIPKNQ